MNMTSLRETDHNIIYGNITIGNGGNNTNARSTLTANAVVNGSVVSQTLGSAPIFLTSSTGSTTHQTGTLNIRLSSANLSAPHTGITTWTNDVTLSGTKQQATITLDRGDGISSGFTHQMDELTLSGATRNLTVTASNGSTLEFTGNTTLTHTAATTQTLNVSAGTLAVNNVGESGVGAKGRCGRAVSAGQLLRSATSRPS
ncbi:MAG: hypothetical protein HC828_05055, partial [Blastochloris sp.]|nr:hypothetical protein [Blastochloris sp.]